jgi:hypothetical protein
MKTLMSILLACIPVFLSAQEELSVLDLFGRLPLEAFGTCDDITESDIEELIHNGRTDFWTVDTETKTEFSFSAGDQSVSVLKVGFGNNQMAAVNSTCAQSSFVKIWAFDKNSNQLIQKDLLPELTVFDFFSIDDAEMIPVDYVPSTTYYIDDGKIVGSIHTRMEPELEYYEVKYELFIEFDKGRFKKIKKEINN